MRIKLSIVTALFLSLFLHQVVWAATQLQASVSDNSIYLGDLFVLTITIDDNDSDLQLDTRPLEKEFNVYRPSQNRSSSYINGKASHQTQWQITLQAKQIGELTIPALQVGSLTTEAIKITVKKPSAQATETADHLIFMENSLNKSSAYLEQPLIFTSKIYIAQNQSSRELELIAPDLADATVTVYGEDKNGQTIRNGIRYKTITRQFEINAAKAGSFTISSPLLAGNLRKRVKVDEWRERIISEPINIRGDSLQVTIKEKPADYQGKWLVSEDVRLFEKTPLTQQSYQVGEPITRSITLQIASIDKEKLPNISFNYPKDLRFYPDQDELQEGQANGLHYAQRTIRHAIIADQPGELTLPEIKLPWWNSEIDKQEFAVIPAQTLTILAAEKQTAEIPVNEIATPATDKEQMPTTVIVDNKALIIWQVICAVLLLALIMLTFYHLHYRRSQSVNKNKKPVQTSNKNYLNLQEALNKQQAPLAYQALLNYAQSEFPTLKSLSQLATRMNLDTQDKAELAAEIKILEKACADPAINWGSAQLSRLIEKHSRQKDTRISEDIMNLNPS